MTNFVKTNACWCGFQKLSSFSEHYLICDNCCTLIASQRSLDEYYKAGDDAFYGKEYWIKHVKEDYNFPDIFERSRLDLSERCLYWLKNIMKYKLPPAKTLELGCAHGGLVYLMKMAGFDSVGTEMSPWICNYASTTFNIPMLCGRIEDLYLEEKGFDIVILMDILEHMTDPLSSMHEISRVLKDNGIVVIQTPCLKDTQKKYEAMKRENDIFLEQLKEEEHLFIFNANSIKLILEKAGFKYFSFEPQFFEYDMFLFASKSPFDIISEDMIIDFLLNTANGRIILAMIDLFNNAERLLRNLRESEADREERLRIMNVLGKKIEEIETDHEARLRVINELDRKLKESETDREERLRMINDLDKKLKEVERDRENRLKVINILNNKLNESEADREERLRMINDLDKKLKEVERDRENRLKVINILNNKLNESEADREAQLKLINNLKTRIEEIESGYAVQLKVIEELNEKIQESLKYDARRIGIYKVLKILFKRMLRRIYGYQCRN